MPASVRESKANEAGSGPNMSESFACYDRDTSSWRTSQRSLFAAWVEFSETWPRAGMTRSGSAYRREPLVCHTKEIDFLLLPTPTYSDWKRRPLKKKYSYKPITHGTADSLNQFIARRFFALNPTAIRCWFSPTLWEVIQGFPIAHTELRDSETPSSHKSQSFWDD